MRAITTSLGIARDTLLPVLLEREVVRGLTHANKSDVIVGWGEKPNTKRAREYSEKNKLPYWRMEDGFIGYLSHPSIDDRRVSLIVDTKGVYYDARKSSDLEDMLCHCAPLNDEQLKRCRLAMSLIKKWGLSKYNHAPDHLSKTTQGLFDNTESRVLLVDQTRGDMSITAGLATASSFKTMLDMALIEHPDSDIFIKVHPDVLVGTKKGHFEDINLNDRTHLIADICAPKSLFDMVEHVYVVTSQMGVEALIAGKQVTCFGMPFYAGWGLTDDRVACERRDRELTLLELFHCAFLNYTRYIDPNTGLQCALESVLDLLITDKQILRPRADRLLAVGFSPWKRGFVPAFVGSGVKKIRWAGPKVLKNIKYSDGDAVLLWGCKHDHLTGLVPAHIPIWRMEDGFLRSAGLGSDMARPASLVFDSRGIYYDGQRPSDLEYFYKNHKFSHRDRMRAKQLIQQMKTSRISKYNVGTRGKISFSEAANGREIILVPGQVEGDASLKYGSPVTYTNAGLLEAVKERCPDAYIVYKPHPDVLAGNRQGAVSKAVLDSCADKIVLEADIIDCMDAVESVHTMTSQAGFEAIVQGKAVTVYGLPFYAGWGLSEDVLPVERRGRSLTVTELVYGALIAYPKYVCWPGGCSYSPEALTNDLVKAKRDGKLFNPGIKGRIKRLSLKVKNTFVAMFR